MSRAAKPKPTIGPAANAADDPNGAITNTLAAKTSRNHLRAECSIVRDPFIPSSFDQSDVWSDRSCGEYDRTGPAA
jgi:hypothetical protein